MFKEYNGTKLLCELFEKHKDLSIFNTLVRVIDSRDGSTLHYFLLILLLRGFIELTNNFFVKNIEEAICDIFTNKIDERTAISFLNILNTLIDKVGVVSLNKKLFKNLAAVTNKFIGNKTFCMEVLNYFRFCSLNIHDGKN